MSAVLLGALAAWCVGCHDCTEIGCGTETTLRFEPALSVPGNYVVVVSSEDGELECTGSLPGAAMWGCTKHGRVLGTDDSSGAPGGATGSGGATSQVTGVVVQGRPERLTVSVTRDDGEAWSRVVEPTFVETEPNGPGCGSCAQGTAVVEGP